MARIGVALRAAALDLQHLSLELLTNAKPRLPPGHAVASDAMRREAARLVAGEEASPAERAAIEATTQRLVDARGQIRRLERALGDDAAAEAAIGQDRSFRVRAAPLLRSAPAERAAQRRIRRCFAIAARLAAAMMAGAIVAVSLGGARPRQLGAADDRGRSCAPATGGRVSAATIGSSGPWSAA